MNNFNRLIEIAKAINGPGRSKKYSHISFICKGTQIKCIGWNKNKTHPMTIRFPYKSSYYSDIHSEVDAVNKYGINNCKRHDLIVIRIRATGKLGLSKPCMGCQKFLEKLDFQNIWYSTDEGEFEKLGIKQTV